MQRIPQSTDHEAQGDADERTCGPSEPCERRGGARCTPQAVAGRSVPGTVVASVAPVMRLVDVGQLLEASPDAVRDSLRQVSGYDSVANVRERELLGTISDRVASIGFANIAALGPSAKYSSHAEESTTFIHGRYPEARWCLCPSATLAQPWLAAPARAVSDPDTQWHGVFHQA